MKDAVKSKPLVALLTNNDDDVYCFRLELVQAIIDAGYDILISCPNGPKFELMKDIPYIYDDPVIDRRGTSVKNDFKLMRHYHKLFKKHRPSVVLTYTIKPNIYGGIAARGLKITQFANVTGLGTSIEDGGVLGKVVPKLYKFGFKKTKTVFFQNQKNLEYFKDNGIVKSDFTLVPGSGVNLNRHCFEEYPEKSEETVFLIIGRIMKNKGTDEILEAAEFITKKYKNVKFRFIGFYEDDYKEKIEDAVNRGIVEYFGNQKDVHPFIKESHATIMASYHEGMSNALLETAATGRPVIATDIPGCREIFDPFVSGIPFKPKDSDALVQALEKFLSLSYEERKAMGIAGRKKVEKQFDRKIVVNRYIEEIQKEVK